MISNNYICSVPSEKDIMLHTRSQRLKEWMENNGFTQKKLSELMKSISYNWEQPRISDFLTGKRKITEETIDKILLLQDIIIYENVYFANGERAEIKNPVSKAWFLGLHGEKSEEAERKAAESAKKAAIERHITEISQMLIGALLKNDGIDVEENKTDPLSLEYILAREDQGGTGLPINKKDLENLLDELSVDLARMADEFLRSHLKCYDYKGGNYNGKY